VKSFDFSERIFDLVTLNKLSFLIAGDLFALYDKSLSRREPHNRVATPFLAALY
jgi:hypothetical protein